MRIHIDDRHESLGAQWLAAYLPPSVSEPVRLHVEAKRYLCTVEPGYAQRLAGDSVMSLKLQGGLMADEECEAFLAKPFSAEAIRLRRFDEAAKDPSATTPGLEHFLSYVDAVSAKRVTA